MITNPSPKKKSANFVSGLAIGTAVAAAAAFLYKTKKGKKIRKHLANNLDDAKGFLKEHLKETELKAKKLEATLEENNQATIKKAKTAKRKIAKNLQKTTSEIKKKVFLKSGKPLAK